MIRMGKVILMMSLVFLLSACASSGGHSDLSNDWRNCMVAGLTVGAATGIGRDSDDVRDGAIIGAVVGSVWCALMRKDEDGDGVRDDDDRCPGTFKGAEVDQNGCELDFDGDGVADRLDECPDTASGARVDARGCELDDDGDGVVNSKDQCPNTPAGASVDANGCELDDDNDGVANSKDQCPDTQAGQAVDNNGCDLAENYTLEGIYFEFDSSYLNKEAKTELHKVVDLMNKCPKMLIESASHTDSQGPTGYNMWLSDRRAKRTVDYILEKAELLK